MASNDPDLESCKFGEFKLSSDWDGLADPSLKIEETSVNGELALEILTVGVFMAVDLEVSKFRGVEGRLAIVELFFCRERSNFVIDAQSCPISLVARQEGLINVVGRLNRLVGSDPRGPAFELAIPS